MQLQSPFRFHTPKLEIIADIVYPMQNPLYAVRMYINGIPIIVDPAIHIIPTIFKLSRIEILTNFALSIT